MVDNSDIKKWKVKLDGSKQELTVPAIIILIPPTDPAALDAALR